MRHVRLAPSFVHQCPPRSLPLAYPFRDQTEEGVCYGGGPTGALVRLRRAQVSYPAILSPSRPRGGGARNPWTKPLLHILISAISHFFERGVSLERGSFSKFLQFFFNINKRNSRLYIYIFLISQQTKFSCLPNNNNKKLHLTLRLTAKENNK